MSSFDALVQVLRVLQQRRIPYMLVGAFSSNAYGYPRATKDADIVIQYYDGVLNEICESLGPEFNPNYSRIVHCGSVFTESRIWT